MINWFSTFLPRIQIKLLALYNPTVLFDKINQLDWYKSTLRQWVEDQSLPANCKVLEIGCATGALTNYLARSDCIPTGVDYSSKMIEVAKSKNPDMEYLVADVMNLPIRSDSFDVVLATSLLNIVDDKIRAMTEISRTCKKGGLITILVPSADFTDEDFSILQSSLKTSGFSFAAMEAWHNFPPKMKTSEIIKLFDRAGLKDTATKKYLGGMVISASAVK